MNSFSDIKVGLVSLLVKCPPLDPSKNEEVKEDEKTATAVPGQSTLFRIVYQTKFTPAWYHGVEIEMVRDISVVKNNELIHFHSISCLSLVSHYYHLV